MRLLREFPREAGLLQGFSIADESTSRDLLRETLVENKLQEIFHLQKAYEHISQCKDALMLPSDLESAQHIVNRLIVKKLLEDYERRLRLYNLVDFDDIVYRSVLMLRNNPSVRDVICARYQHFLVD